jgi:hypothetical protein
MAYLPVFSCIRIANLRYFFCDGNHRTEKFARILERKADSVPEKTAKYATWAAYGRPSEHFDKISLLAG